MARSIKYNEMVTALAKPGDAIVSSMTGAEAHVLHMAIGISGEVAELLTAFRAEDWDNALEELGDIEFYFEGLCQGANHAVPYTVVQPTEVKIDPLPDLLIQAGNVLDVCKRIAIYKDESKWKALPPELERFRTKLDEFYALSEMTREAAIDNNIAKLSKRYAKMTYSDDAAVARADKE